MKSVMTTGEHVEKDVVENFTCWACEGTGYFRARDSQEEDTACLECHGTGLSI